ncbi:hypothetical protein D3C72_1304350 [compost metagenome]
MKSAPRLRRFERRTMRSPRISCSPMTASVPVSKPASRLSTAEAASPLPSFSTSFNEATGLIFSSPCSFSTCSSRSSEPSDQPVISTFQPLARRSAICFTARSKTLTRSSLSPSVGGRAQRGPTWASSVATGRPSLSCSLKGVRRTALTATSAASKLLPSR